MTNIKIRQKVHDYVDHADDHILKMVYSILKENKKPESGESLLNESQKNEIDRRWENYQNGKRNGTLF